MSILIVDDSVIVRETLSKTLRDEGYVVSVAESAQEAFDVLQLDRTQGSSDVDLILMDVMMPDTDGISATNIIKANPRTRDIPIIMVTARSDADDLQVAFAAGAIDFIGKPPNIVELLARVRSVLRLKHEMDRRKARELELLEVTKQLEEANSRLQRLSALDGLTGINNRRKFEDLCSREWRRAAREKYPITIAMLDIDHFKAFNDEYGHIAGDDTLTAVAQSLSGSLNRAGDFVARYGGEEFVIVLPETDAEGGEQVAQRVLQNLEKLTIPHRGSTTSEYLTASIGVASCIPAQDSQFEELVHKADGALYKSKANGRNQISLAI